MRSRVLWGAVLDSHHSHSAPLVIGGSRLAQQTHRGANPIGRREAALARTTADGPARDLGFQTPADTFSDLHSCANPGLVGGSHWLAPLALGPARDRGEHGGSTDA